jgi:ribosomal protein S18 acetylase RimI-like enzyme
MTASLAEVGWRAIPTLQDPARIRALTQATGFFYDHEVDIAEELVAERLAKGERSGYLFVFADQGDRVVGYSCYGPIACTQSSWDLFWIAVAPELQRIGLGRELMHRSEVLIRQAGGSRVYVETSARPQYESTRAFYERIGYTLASLLPEFYGPGDDKATYCKVL